MATGAGIGDFPTDAGRAGATAFWPLGFVSAGVGAAALTTTTVLTGAVAFFGAGLAAGLAAGFGVVFDCGATLKLGAGFLRAAAPAFFLAAALAGLENTFLVAVAFFGAVFFFAAGLGATRLTDLARVGFFLAGDFMRRQNRSGATRCGVGPHGFERRPLVPTQQWFCWPQPVSRAVNSPRPAACWAALHRRPQLCQGRQFVRLRFPIGVEQAGINPRQPPDAIAQLGVNF